MRNSFKKALSSVLLATIILSSACLGVFAEAAADTVINQASIRVFSTDAELSITLNGTPNAEVSVLVLDPGVNLPDMSTNYEEFYSGVTHVDFITLDDSGKLTYKYKAEQAGFYTIRVKGAEIEYTSTNNDAPLSNPDKIYVEAWSSGGRYSHPDLNYRISLSKGQLDTYGAEVVAQNIKQQLERQAEGRRTLFITNSLAPATLSDSGIWWDAGVALTSEILEEFFKALHDIGGMVDFIYTDTEQGYTMWRLAELDSDAFKAAIARITADERYPEFEERLLSRGYDKTADGSTPLSSIKAYTNRTHCNYLKFNAVCSELAAEYLTQAIYEPAKKYFANVKYCDYGFGESKVWQGRYDIGGSHPIYRGGNSVKAGTHSAPVIYEDSIRNVAHQQIFGIPGEDGSTDEKKTIYSGASGDFSKLQGTIAVLRNSVNSEETPMFTPWIEMSGNTSYENMDYRSETILHVALHNPDRMLYFNPDSGSDDAARAEELMKAMDEVNSLVAFDDRRTLNTEQADLSLPFALSGMYANGRNIWRITPDTAVADSDFLTSADGKDPQFTVGDAVITFPEGTIKELSATVSEIGYWVETPVGVTPVITYAESLKTETEAAVISFYDELGHKADLDTEEVVDAVASYKGYYGDKLQFIAAKYDADGMLIDIEAKECGVFSPSGNTAFFNIGKDLDTDKIKFFLWENETIRPLATEIID